MKGSVYAALLSFAAFTLAQPTENKLEARASAKALSCDPTPACPTAAASSLVNGLAAPTNTGIPSAPAEWSYIESNGACTIWAYFMGAGVTGQKPSTYANIGNGAQGILTDPDCTKNGKVSGHNTAGGNAFYAIYLGTDIPTEPPVLES